MLRFVMIRLVALVVTLLVASLIVYGALYIAPGSPIAFLVGGHGASPRVIAQLNAQYHLTDSFPTAYWRWLSGVLQGHFGQSIVERTSVVTLIKPRLSTSLFLVSYAALFIVSFGVGSGVVSALRPKRLGRVLLFITTVAMAVPPFVSAVVLITVFGVDLGWFPTLGGGTGFLGNIYHLTLPAIALALASIAYISRVTRAAVSDELAREHVETARARGIPERLVVRRHVLRNSWIPISTVASISVATLIAGDAIVEVAFGLNGIGAYLIQAVEEKDFPVVQAIVLLLVAVFVVMNMLVDLGYAIADPRVRK
jgi:peptide/nickel transport system permease protein